MSKMEDPIKKFYENNEKKIKVAFQSEENQKEIDKWFPDEKDFTPEDWKKVDEIAYDIFKKRVSGNETEQEDLAKVFDRNPEEFKGKSVDDMLTKDGVPKGTSQAEEYMRNWDKETALEIYKKKKYEWKKAEIEHRKNQVQKEEDKPPFNAPVPFRERGELPVKKEESGLPDVRAEGQIRQGASQGRDLGSRGSRTDMPLKPFAKEEGWLVKKDETVYHAEPIPRSPGFKEIEYKPVVVEKGEKIKVNVINIDEIAKGYAWRLAEEKVRELLHRPEENMQSGGRLKSIWNQISAPFRHPVDFGRKAWVRMAENGYREKFYQEALAEISNDQNLLLEIEASARLNAPIAKTNDPNQRDRHFDILNKIIEEYSQNAAEQEEKGRQSVDSPPVDAAFKGLINQYYQYAKANPGLSPSDRRSWFEQEQKSMINGLKGQGYLSDADFLGGTGRSLDESREGRMYASNLFNVAEDYMAHVDSKLAEMAKENNFTPEQMQKAREHVMSTMDLDINLGAKLSDIHNKKPQGTLNRFERLITNSVQNIPILRRIATSPGAAAVLGAVGGTLLGRGLVRGAATLGLGTAGVLTGAWIPIIGAMAAGGAFGAIRRNLELKWDRGMHQRQTALGKEFDDFRRGKMDEFKYDVETTGELQTRLNNIVQAGKYADLNGGQKEQLVDMFARFKFELARDRDFRINKRANRTVDLIAVSREEGEKFGTNLMSKTDLKIELYKYLKNNNLIGDIHDPLPTGNPNNAEFNALFRDRILELDKNVNDADAAFLEYRARSVMVMGTIGAMAAGLGACAGRELYEGWLGGGRSGEATSALAVAGAGTKLKPGILNPIEHNGKHFEFFVNSDGETIDLAKSHIPPGWQPTPDGKGLVLEARGGTAVDFREFARQSGQSTDQRVSYGKFAYQGSAPDRGVRALPETLRNLASNRRLHANFTELMMQYKQDANGDVYVDASQMFGKSIKGPLKEVGVQMKQALERGEKFYMALAPSNNDSQFHPILLEMGVDGKIKVPKEIAKTFFAFDKSGKLLQGSGKHPGLHQLLYDTGQRRPDGAMRAVGISATLGQEPTLNVPPTHDELIFVPQSEERDTPLVVPFSSTPRWQMEGQRRRESEKPDINEKKPDAVKAGNVVRVDNAERVREEVKDSAVARRSPGGEPVKQEVEVERAGQLTPSETPKSETVARQVQEEDGGNAGLRKPQEAPKAETAGANQTRKEEDNILTKADQLLREGKKEQYEALVQKQALSELNLRENYQAGIYEATTEKEQSEFYSEIYARALGLGKMNSQKDLKRAYRVKAMFLHSDKNSDQSQFVRDVRAEQFKILTDLREKYEEHAESLKKQSDSTAFSSVRPATPRAANVQNRRRAYV